MVSHHKSINMKHHTGEWRIQTIISSCLLLVYGNAWNFCTLILYNEILLKLLIRLRGFGEKMMGFSKYIIMWSAIRDKLTFSLRIWIPFTSFSCLISLARASNTLLNRSSERGHHYLVPVFKGNATKFCSFSVILAVSLP